MGSGRVRLLVMKPVQGEGRWKVSEYSRETRPRNTAGARPERRESGKAGEGEKEEGDTACLTKRGCEWGGRQPPQSSPQNPSLRSDPPPHLRPRSPSHHPLHARQSGHPPPCPPPLPPPPCTPAPRHPPPCTPALRRPCPSVTAPAPASPCTPSPPRRLLQRPSPPGFTCDRTIKPRHSGARGSRVMWRVGMLAPSGGFIDARPPPRGWAEHCTCKTVKARIWPSVLPRDTPEKHRRRAPGEARERESMQGRERGERKSWHGGG